MQIEFIFTPADRLRTGDTERLQSLLTGNAWMTGASIRARLGWTERRLRAAASASDGNVLSWPGSKGYCLTAEAEIDEIAHGTSAMRRQADEMIARAKAIERAYLPTYSRIRSVSLDEALEERE